MALVTPNLQPRSRQPRDWGNYATASLLPNASGAPLAAAKFALEEGDTAFVTGVGTWVCLVAGVAAGGDAIWAPTGAMSGRDLLYLFDDFISSAGPGNTGWTVGTSGAGSGAFAFAPPAGDNAHRGILRLGSGTTAGGRSVLNRGVTSHRLPVLAGGRLAYETLVQVPTLADAVEDYFLNLGVSDNITGGVPTNGIVWRYDFPTLTWNGVLRIAGADTAVVVGSAVVAGQWVRLLFDYTFGIGLRFFIAAPSPGPLVQVGATVPPATVDPLGAVAGVFAPQLKMQKVAGVTNRDLRSDYVAFLYATPDAR